MIYYYDLRRVPLFLPLFRECGLACASHHRSLVHSALCRLPYINHLPPSFFYNAPHFEDGSDKIIVFDSNASLRMLEWLRKNHPEKRLILWYWNESSSSGFKRVLPEWLEQWSFSESDCEKYGFRHNTQFFFDCFAEDAAECRSVKRDNASPKVLFIGRDKGRGKIIVEIADTLRNAGAEVTLEIAPKISGPFKTYREKLLKLLPYRQVIDRVKESDVLLDYTLNPSTGLSLRCMESLFFGKKLITNNRTVLKADFYSPSNIYVLGEDTRELRQFLKDPITEVDDGIRDRYLLSNWLKRFDLK